MLLSHGLHCSQCNYYQHNLYVLSANLLPNTNRFLRIIGDKMNPNSDLYTHQFNKFITSVMNGTHTHKKMGDAFLIH